MKKRLSILAIGAVALAQGPMDADAGQRRHSFCKPAAAVGSWAFATDVGHETIAFGGDITAIGIFDVLVDGSVAGVFDVTFQNQASIPSVPFGGNLTLDSDCRGTLTFTTGTGSTRTDSIILINPYEMWGMSRDPANLWTYRVRRLPN